MPLSPPVERAPRHHRRIACDGYRRADGLWDIEAHLVDTKPFDLPNRDREDGRIDAGEPLHDMWLRVTVDDTMLIHAVEAVTDAGPFAICPRITDNYRRLEGERIGPGWRRRVRELLGGTEGCTHLRELLTPLATTAFQTIYGSGYADTSHAHERQRDNGGREGVMKFLIGSCHALASDSEVVRDFWPRYYRPKNGSDD
jgi:hypothetical protein